MSPASTVGWFSTEMVALSSGQATGREELNAFDYALRDAGVADFNLIKVTSIVPPSARVRRLAPAAVPVLGEGVMAPTIYTSATSSKPGVRLAAAVGVGKPISARPEAGLVYVWSGEGTEQDAEGHIRRMVEDGMRVRGRDKFDVDLVVSSIETSDDGTFACALACALFCDSHIEALFRNSAFE
jgi:arginine decarboxylase